MTHNGMAPTGSSAALVVLVADDEVVLPERQHDIHLAIVRLLRITRHRLPQCARLSFLAVSAVWLLPTYRNGV
jgi:hypothetical protein